VITWSKEPEFQQAVEALERGVPIEAGKLDTLSQIQQELQRRIDMRGIENVSDANLIAMHRTLSKKINKKGIASILGGEAFFSWRNIDRGDGKTLLDEVLNKFKSDPKFRKEITQLVEAYRAEPEVLREKIERMMFRGRTADQHQQSFIDHMVLIIERLRSVGDSKQLTRNPALFALYRWKPQVWLKVFPDIEDNEAGPWLTLYDFLAGKLSKRFPHDRIPQFGNEQDLKAALTVLINKTRRRN